MPKFNNVDIYDSSYEIAEEVVKTLDGYNPGIKPVSQDSTYSILLEILKLVGNTLKAKTEPLTVTQNGTYTAPKGTAYTPIDVQVPDGKIVVTDGMTFGKSTWTEIPEIFDFSNTTRFGNMFWLCHKLLSAKMDLSKAVSCLGMFRTCGDLREVTIIPPAQPFNCKLMFEGCEKLTSINITGTLPEQDYDMNLQDCPLNGGNVDIILNALPETIDEHYIVLGQHNIDAALPTFINEAQRKGWQILDKPPVK